MERDKVIISCAVTGSVHTPSMSPYLALTPEQIAEQAIAAAQAGAAILHLHARDPKDGHPSADPRVFDQFVPRIKAATDAVINITTGGSTRMTLQERLAYPRKTGGACQRHPSDTGLRLPTGAPNHPPRTARAYGSGRQGSPLRCHLQGHFPRHAWPRAGRRG
jgi:hypothetical protein